MRCDGNRVRFGIDLGGTKTELIALDDVGSELLRFRRSTPAGDYRASLQLISEMVQKAETKLGCTATVGIGTPGAVSRSSGLMKNCNSTWLNGRPFREEIETLLQRQIRTSNDANCFAMSEAVDGAGAEAKTVFGIIVGTGTGAGIVIDGHILEGVNGIAGEWGHNPLPWPTDDERPGPACYCGRNGCIETWLSGPGMAADHQQHTGHTLTAEEIAAGATQGHTDCMQTMSRYTHRLARGLAHVINILDPDVIVLGGGMSNIASFYEAVPALWHEFIFSDTIETQLRPPAHGDSSGVRGAAWLWE
ncbi:MAG TPA: ROK family protein [Mariprofundaceae bacterium]|nr:ROK family protein [Mariprofundaceae bacterium]